MTHHDITMTSYMVYSLLVWCLCKTLKRRGLDHSLTERHHGVCYLDIYTISKRSKVRYISNAVDM